MSSSGKPRATRVPKRVLETEGQGDPNPAPAKQVKNVASDGAETGAPPRAKEVPAPIDNAGDGKVKGKLYPFDAIDPSLITVRTSEYYNRDFQEVALEVFHDGKLLDFRIPPSVCTYSHLHALGMSGFKSTSDASIKEVKARDLTVHVQLGELPESLKDSLGEVHQRAVLKYREVVNAVCEEMIKSGKVRPGVYDRVYGTERAKLVRMAKADAVGEAEEMARESASEAFFKDAYIPEFTQSDEGELSVIIKAKAKATFQKKKDENADDDEPPVFDPFVFMDKDKLSHDEIERVMGIMPEHRIREVNYTEPEPHKKKLGQTEYVENKAHQELKYGDLCNFSFGMSVYSGKPHKKGLGKMGIKLTLKPFFPKVVIFGRAKDIGHLGSRENYGGQEEGPEVYDNYGLEIIGQSASSAGGDASATACTGDNDMTFGN